MDIQRVRQKYNITLHPGWVKRPIPITLDTQREKERERERERGRKRMSKGSDSHLRCETINPVSTPYILNLDRVLFTTLSPYVPPLNEPPFTSSNRGFPLLMYFISSARFYLPFPFQFRSSILKSCPFSDKDNKGLHFSKFE